MTLNKGDFVSINFTGKDQEANEVFDTTKKEVAKEHGLGNPNMDFSPITVCVGKGHVLAGLDKALVGKKETGTFSITLQPEDAFGKKQANNIKLMPLKVFHKQKINPQPGLDVNIDGVRGRVKSISGNRVVVDFNNPLSGRVIEYEVEILGKITDLKEQVTAVVSRALRFEADITIADKKATITLPFELPKPVQEEVTKQVTELTDITNVVYAKTKA